MLFEIFVPIFIVAVVVVVVVVCTSFHSSSTYTLY